MQENALETGHNIIKSYLPTLSHSPGVYRMLSQTDSVLYVGKARSLRNRVASYARATGHNARISSMISQTAKMMFITTKTETEALLLEQNLIKQLKPKYNILLRDDKAFPEIFINTDHDFPQIERHRGAHKREGHYFGPFASGASVSRTLQHLERVFGLRNCSDGEFQSRTRPCLQYQIGRCTAPCVGKISQMDYGKRVEQSLEFMQGRSHRIQKQLSLEMQEASANMEYEKAGFLRDRIAALTAIQSAQNINPETVSDADVIAFARMGGVSCIQIFFIRSHQNWGNHAYFPKLAEDEDIAESLEGFIGQFYHQRTPPPLLLLSDELNEPELWAAALSEKRDKKVEIHVPKRGEKLALVNEAMRNAKEAAARSFAQSSTQEALLKALAERFSLSKPPSRIEVYDNSHIQGAFSVGAMIVAGQEGFLKSSYRKYNIQSQDITAGDDFGMMKEVLSRRFRRLEEGSEPMPDLILIDGGAGQLSKVHEALADFDLNIEIIAVAKGVDRNAGKEEFYQKGHLVRALSKNDPVLHFVQRLRDEAHRFAIGAHHNKRSAAITRSQLDDVPNIGPRRKRALLLHFGSVKAVKDARVEDLQQVDGISKAMAEIIYGFFHHNQA